MRTANAHRRQGVARAILARILQEANERSYQRLWLETGSAVAFEPARQLYTSAGFGFCAPFGEYRADPHSVFMMKAL
jgi:putative acetyltransferase